MSVGIFFGSTTGNTENIAEMIKTELGDLVTHMANIVDAEPNDLLSYDVLILGIPTWNVGELQDDWDSIFSSYKELNFSGKTAAFFGCASTT